MASAAWSLKARKRWRPSSNPSQKRPRGSCWVSPSQTKRKLSARPISTGPSTFPPKPLRPGGEGALPKRGEVSYRIVGEEKEAEVLETVAHLLESGAHHVLLFFKTEDQAADFGDFLSLHGVHGWSHR